MRRRTDFALMALVLVLAACEPDTTAAPEPSRPPLPPKTSSASPTRSPVTVPSLPPVNPGDQILARVPVRGPGAYSAGPFSVAAGHLNSYFACTGGGAIKITLANLVSYTEPCSASSLTSGLDVHDVSSATSVLLTVEAHDATEWSFILAFHP